MSLTKLPLGRNNSVMTSLFPPRESLVVTSWLGTGNSRTFFLRCSLCSHAHPWSCLVLNCSCHYLSVSLLSSNCLCRCSLQFFILLFLCPFPLIFSVSMSYPWRTALYRKSDWCCIPRNETARPHSPIPAVMYLCVIYIYSQDQSAFLAAAKVGRPILAIYKSLTDTWMWKLGDRTL